MKYTVTILVETSRKMQGSDEFLLCTAQRAGLKRRLMNAEVLMQTVVPGHCVAGLRVQFNREQSGKGIKNRKKS